MRRWILGVLVLVVFLYILVCLAVYFYQRSLMYFPQPRHVSAAESTMKMPVNGAEITVTVRQHAGPKAIVYFGGNGEDVSYNLDAFSTWFPEHSLYLMHYRSYGGSTGSPTEESNHADAAELFRVVHAQHPEIAVIGRSLGTGVAVRLASTQPASRLILVTPYDTITEIAGNAYWFLPTRWLLLDKYESSRYAPAINVPTTVIVAEHDVEIPRSSSDKLMTRFAPGIAKLVEIPGADHNSIMNRPGYRSALQSGLSAR